MRSMFRVMLCGAADTSSVAEEFAAAVRAVGGDPWHYLDGQILYLNNATADFRRNSAQTVRTSDAIVFVILRSYGSISWDTELHQAIDDGKPLVILCLDSTYRAYLQRTSSDGIDPRLVDTLMSLEVDRSLTIVPFGPGTFRLQLARELARLFQAGLSALQVRNRRETLGVLLGDAAHLAPHDLELAREVALDEFEDKRLRKQAVRALAATIGADAETITDLIRSDEQGVARLALSLLPSLHRADPPDQGLLEEIVEICNDSDDVGLGRRLVSQLFEAAPALAVMVLHGLSVADIGLRRRLAGGIDQHLDVLLKDATLIAATIELLQRCVNRSGEASWLQRAKALLADLEGRSTLDTEPRDASGS